MPHVIPTLLLLLLSTMPAHADPHAATEQIRDRLREEWQHFVDGEKRHGWRIEVGHPTLTGDWAIKLGDGWWYFFERGTVRCRLQPNASMFCGEHAYATPRWTAGQAPPITVDRDTNIGRAIVETIVSTPPGAIRTSRRYRASVALATKTFAIGTPVLVEEYQEICHATHGCHSTHWSCQRLQR